MKRATALYVVSEEVCGEYSFPEGFEDLRDHGLDAFERERVRKVIEKHRLPLNLNKTAKALRVFAEKVLSGTDARSAIGSAEHAYWLIGKRKGICTAARQINAAASMFASPKGAAACRRTRQIFSQYLQLWETKWLEAAGGMQQPVLDKGDLEYASQRRRCETVFAAEKKGVEAYTHTVQVPQEGPLSIRDKDPEHRISDAAVSVAFYEPEKLKRVVQALDEEWQKVRKEVDPIILAEFGEEGFALCGLLNPPVTA